MFSKILSLEESPYSAEDAEWDQFVANHPQGSLLQTTAWAKLKGRFGWSTERVWLRQNGKLVAGAQILIRSVAFGIVKMGYVPHGPLVNWQNGEQVEVLLNQMDWAMYRSRAGILKIEPLLWQNEYPSDLWQTLCHQYKLLPNSDTIQPPRTILLDLRLTEDEILAQMRQKTRYNIRLAAKKGVTVRQGDVPDLPAFVQMIATTGQRNNFGIHAPRYYQDAYQRFSPDQVALFIAEYEQKPVAGVMVFAYGKQGAYLYGASSNEERERMPTYAAQWAAIQWAKERGCISYDLWGVPDMPEAELEEQFEQRHDGLWGVYRFKRGFGGELKRTVGAADRVYNQLLYRLYQWRRQKMRTTS